MSRKAKDILFFVCKVILSCVIIITILRVYVWYNNKPLDTFVNTLFYLAIFFLTLGFISILITFLKGNGNDISYTDTTVHIEHEEHTYKNFLNYTTLLILDGTVFILISFFLTFWISYLIATS